MLIALRRLFDHMAWADRELVGALDGDSVAPAEALREYVHILGADEVWLARLERRSAAVAVWPTMEMPQVREFVRALHAGYAGYLARLDAAALAEMVPYTNSAGLSFETSVQDILLHVSLHAQYHRGRVNLLLRGAGLAPAPADYITFVRGVPAATARTALPTPDPVAGSPISARAREQAPGE
jgi:uncharacterized damage-inducible protein DinB